MLDGMEGDSVVDEGGRMDWLFDWFRSDPDVQTKAQEFRKNRGRK